jgi:hypothetical protein
MTVARVLNDTERQYWHFMSRTDPENPHRVKIKGFGWAPQTVRYQGGTSALNLSPSFQALVQKINTPEAFKYVKRKASGWVNQGPWPKIEQVTFGSNLVDVIKVVGNKAYIRSMDAKKPAPDVTFESDPYVVHKFTVVTPDGTVVEPPKGVTYVLVVGLTPLWIPVLDLEFLETPDVEPEPIRKIWVTAGTIIYQMPDMNKVGIARGGEYVVLADGPRGWVRIGEREWVKRKR